MMRPPSFHICSAAILLILVAIGARQAFSASAARVEPLLNGEAMIAETLIPFKVVEADLANLRRYEVEGALPSECALSRDAYYADTFQLKCITEKAGLRLKFTFYSDGVYFTVFSSPFAIRRLRAGWQVFRPVATGGP